MDSALFEFLWTVLTQTDFPAQMQHPGLVSLSAGHSGVLVNLDSVALVCAKTSALFVLNNLIRAQLTRAKTTIQWFEVYQRFIIFSNIILCLS